MCDFLRIFNTMLWEKLFQQVSSNTPVINIERNRSLRFLQVVLLIALVGGLVGEDLVGMVTGEADHHQTQHRHPGDEEDDARIAHEQRLKGQSKTL